jgi:hypothetical protein
MQWIMMAAMAGIARELCALKPNASAKRVMATIAIGIRQGDPFQITQRLITTLWTALEALRQLVREPRSLHRLPWVTVPNSESAATVTAWLACHGVGGLILFRLHA